MVFGSGEPAVFDPGKRRFRDTPQTFIDPAKKFGVLLADTGMDQILQHRITAAHKGARKAEAPETGFRYRALLNQGIDVAAQKGECHHLRITQRDN